MTNIPSDGEIYGTVFSASVLPARSHTTILGIDCGDFLILGSEARITEVNGRVDQRDFVKHRKINDMVYLVYAGDNAMAEKLVENLIGIVLKSENQEVDYVAQIASKLLEKTCLVDHLYREEKKSEEERLPVNKRTIENVDRVLHIILAGKSSSSPSGFAVYIVDDEIEGLYTPKKINITFGGSGIRHAKDFASNLGYVPETNKTKSLTVEEGKEVAARSIEDATHMDWRSGGKIHLLFLKFNKDLVVTPSTLKDLVVIPSTVVYKQMKPSECTSDYFWVENENFKVKCPKPTHYNQNWGLEQLEQQLIKLRLRLTKDFEVVKE